MYLCDVNRMEDKIKTFAKFGDAGHGGITRYSLSPESIQARDEFVRRMTAIGATIETDDLANMYATIPGSDPNAKRIVMGSHCDSVKNGGNYDGILGVMGAMEVLETVVKENIPHRHPLTAMIWTNEEGSEFPPCMMSSGTVCYDYMPERFRDNFEFSKMMASRSILDPEITFGEKLSTFKYKGDKANRINPNQYKAMFELHIEQGPILEDAGKDVGVVTCVLGQMLYRVKFYGQAAHAGTFPMKKRKDAFHAASEALCYLHNEIDKLGYEDLVYTTGEVVIHPCVNTVIPDFFDFSIDVRHENPEVLNQVREILATLETRQWQGCKCEVVLGWNRDTVYFNEELIGYVRDAVAETDIPYMDINSGAGHDAQYISYMIPTTMIFVVSKDGLSHTEVEYSTPEQCTNGASVMLNAVLKADKAED
ncbi:Zn-dependent hydrolase [Anaerotignum sp. MB30-C6]|uniref:Zn-dependent hydrolase n=1 Tax=Anaerotignum sp. MB30-C6 TaxID=3070814 RepID=UPI0027DC3F20|nr:Zn-dependent hydrolase [Anaerotignum sp. MB30-C6]WMI80472.1 Zn-dependent hydrolase [Anaerotignum sp. MB30-C6]